MGTSVFFFESDSRIVAAALKSEFADGKWKTRQNAQYSLNSVVRVRLLLSMVCMYCNLVGTIWCCGHVHIKYSLMYYRKMTVRKEILDKKYQLSCQMAMTIIGANPIFLFIASLAIRTIYYTST